MADCGYLSRSHEGENGNPSRFCGSQHPSAFLRGRASGEDVIDENEVSVCQCLGANAELEGLAQILQAFPSREGCLARGGADSLESA